MGEEWASGLPFAVKFDAPIVENLSFGGGSSFRQEFKLPYYLLPVK